MKFQIGEWTVYAWRRSRFDRPRMALLTPTWFDWCLGWWNVAAFKEAPHA